MTIISSHQNIKKETHILLHCTLYTCKELTMVNIQANTVVFLLTANTPSTQVSPSTGSSTITDTIRVLQVYMFLGHIKAKLCLIHKRSQDILNVDLIRMRILYYLELLTLTSIEKIWLI